MKAKLHYVFSIAMFLFVFSVYAQNSSWKEIESIEDNTVLSKLNLDNIKSHVFELNTKLFKESLSSVTLRSSKAKQKSIVINIPAQDGKLETFKIYEAPVFAPDLAEKYPNIKSYVGISTDNSGTRLRMSVSHQGVQTMISYIDKPDIFMQPISKGSNKYVLYNRNSKKEKTNEFICKTIDKQNETNNKNGLSSKTAINEGGANNQSLQKFRIAISTTAEYTTYHGNEIDALAAINATLTRVNEVFETDMAVTFELIANNNFIIYTNSASDPYSDLANNDNWNTELQNTLSTTIGESNYDIGHLLGRGNAGGNAGCIGCVCYNGSKGSGYTSLTVPEGDHFDIEYVAHEIGHQMGANHTWAFASEGKGVNSEPGSGTTIMSYAGNQGNNNVELNSDPYFHYHSIKQILSNLTTKSCQTTEAITNNPPVANAGNNYNIPKGTAYVLKGSATDANGSDILSYCWEQIDSGVTTYQNFGPTLVSGSMNRSLPPKLLSDRYIPKLSSVIDGRTIQTNPTLGSDWETVSTVPRTLNWALTVRDRAPASAIGGQSSFDTMQIVVEDVTPFTVINPFSWTQGTSQTIEWVVGQTTNGTINCQNVNIKLSADGSSKFKTTLATNVPNNGSFTFTVPAIPDTDNARILIEAADNIFYDVSDFNFAISSIPDFFIANEVLDPIACNGTTATFNFNYVTVNGFSENTVFSASGNPGSSSVTFSPTSLNMSGTVTMTISNLNSVPLGNYPITITGIASSKTKNKNINLPFFNGHCASVAGTKYETGTTGVTLNTINNLNTGKPSGYSNYKTISTSVSRNSAYDLTVNVNTDENYTVVTKVWIDWNQNCSFDDTGEEYILGETTNVANGPTGNSPLSITIPVGASLGNTVMRVSTKYEGDSGGEFPESCENGFDGEVEDYTINIMPTLAIEEFGFESFTVYPNPNRGAFSIKLNGSLERSINVDVYDIRGRHIYNNRYPNVGDFHQEIQLNNAQLGMYILKVGDGFRKSIKKIVVE